MKARQLPPVGDLANILNALVDQRVDARLRELGVAGSVACYTTEAPAPGTSSRTHNEVCRSGAVPGAVKEGRSWRVSPEAWHKARGQRSAPPKLRIVPTGELSVDELVSGTMAGLRAGGRR